MANTFKFGNKKWATKKDSILAYNDENNNFKPLPFDFSRSSSATVVNEQGLIETVGSNVPRVDYLNDTDGSLLLEPQRSNLITYSEDFTQWATNATITPNSSISPDGTLNASLFSHSGGSFPQVALSGITFVSGSDYIPSLYVKSDGTTQVQHSLIVNGQVVNFTPTDEWVRVSDLIVSPDTSGSFVIAQNSGSAVAASFYIWGAQLEVGSYATSYIPTSGSAVTRAYDTMPSYLDITHLNIGNSYTLFLDADLNVNDNNKVFAFISNSASVVSFSMRNNVGGIRLYNHIDASYPVSGITSSTNKFVIRVDGNSYKIFVQGASLSGTLTTQRNLGELFFYGQNTELKINNFTIDDTALSDAECQALVN